MHQNNRILKSQRDVPPTLIPRAKCACDLGIKWEYCCSFFLLYVINSAPACLFLCFKLIYLKVTAQLFPTSDFRHPVTTPALLYISQALTKVRTACLLSSVLLEGVRLFSPASLPLCMCLCGTSNGLSPSLILFESSAHPLVSHYGFFRS